MIRKKLLTTILVAFIASAPPVFGAPQCFEYDAWIYSKGVTVPDPAVGLPQSELFIQPLGCFEPVPYVLQQGNVVVEPKKNSRRGNPIMGSNFSVIGLPLSGFGISCSPDVFLHTWQEVSEGKSGTRFSFSTIDYVISVNEIPSSTGGPPLLAIRESGELLNGGLINTGREILRLVNATSSANIIYDPERREVNGDAQLVLCFEKS